MIASLHAGVVLSFSQGEDRMRRKNHRSSRSSSPVHRRVFRPKVSPLEPRTLLSNTWCVNSANTGIVNGQTAATGYPTIQAAINAASNGDAIRVENGNAYSEQDTINTPNLTIEADTGQNPVNLGNGTGAGFTVGSSVTGVNISGLTIRNFAEGIVVDSSASATLSGLTISGSSSAGISDAGTLEVGGCSVSNNSGTGIVDSRTLAVTASTIAADSAGFENEPAATLTVTNSTIALNGTASLPSVVGSGPGIQNFGTLAAVNTTIAYNAVGGLDDEPGAQATLDSSIVALNVIYRYFFPIYDDISGCVSWESAHNLIGQGGSGGLTDTVGNKVGVQDPGLASLPGLDNTIGSGAKTLAPPRPSR
jgi:hypothetical protein